MADTGKSKLVGSLRFFRRRESLREGAVVALDAICNWVNPLLVVSSSPREGYGVFATAPLSKGELLVVYGGRVLTEEQLGLLPPGLDMVIQVEDKLFFVPVDLEALGVGERINHSCEPNAGFSGQMSLVAMRDIAAGEEVVMDYATADARESAGFICNCGAAVCRGQVRGSDWQRPELQTELLGYFQPFLQRRIMAIRSARRTGNA